VKIEDVVFSHLRTYFPGPLATLLGGIGSRSIRVLPVNLPMVREVGSDFGVKVVRPYPSHVLHIEHWSARGRLSRTGLYHMWYHDATGLAVRTVIVTTSPRLAHAVPRAYVFRVQGRPPTRIPLEAVHLWRWRAKSVLERRQVALYPFVPVMQDQRPGSVLLAELRERIMQDARTEKEREELRAAASYIAAKRFDLELVESIFGGATEMAKTDIGQIVFKQGLEQGRQEGRQEGEKRGEVAARRKTLLRLMRQKLGVLAPDVEARIAAIEDAARLDELLSRILTAASVAEMGV